MINPPPDGCARELTVRGAILGAAITIIFMAANIYLGLRTGVTFSSSIPAAIISMAVLTAFGGTGILENNIVQTQASAAGTLCNVILVIPGLILVGYWHDFPLWQTMMLCLLGGMFGVAYSVPLRRVMVVESELPFPEGVAAAEVLIAGHRERDTEGGLFELAISACAAALFYLASSGLKLIPDQLVGAFSYGQAVFRFGGGFSLALIGVGYLVRIGACLALLLGVFIAWGIAVPLLTNLAPQAKGDPQGAAEAIWSAKVRLIGAGVIATGGVWTVLSLIRPMISSISSAARNARMKGHVKDPKNRDIPITWVGFAIIALCIPSAGLFTSFAAGSHLVQSYFWFIFAITLAMAVLGFLMASACGYMAALLGSSSSPISGFGILSTMVVAVAFGFCFQNSTGDGEENRFIIALTLFMTSMIVTTISIANDNLQDLKTGYMIGATPWKQQVALIIGVAVGAITIPPIIELLYRAYGFVGSLPRPDMNPENAILAPQATLIAQIAKGIVQHQLAWDMILIGVGLGIILVALEFWLRRRDFSLPALTVGLGIYLPATVVVAIAAGGILGWLGERTFQAKATRSEHARKEEQVKVRRRGVLIASGFLVGESMMGVFITGFDALKGKSGALNYGISASNVSVGTGVVVFAAILAVFYRAVAKPSKT